ncbi:carbon-nitrogen hydrolase family protein [Croceibacterium ferulae]|uniref:carbon-nitrogen hydrolase family protein n=1 Tax=Croceibacterium ferulae TaxID=1854641 RepID=UPI000EAD7CFE|nr:carbon-nitrogen hydrolase family protein [Croceibacterium ferulae]
MTRVAVLQMTSGIDPDANAATIVRAMADAKAGGAAMLFTPEMSLLIDRDRVRSRAQIRTQENDPRLQTLRDAAAREGIWLALGSMAVATAEPAAEGLLANRSLLIGADGNIAASYDKMHMFDVALADGETWRESAAYRPGDGAVTVPDTPVGRLGLTICYDIRFPALFDVLGQAGCDVIATPAAFTVPTGQAHWHLLQRTRAVEASAWVIAAAQVGQHADGRTTYGHSLVVDPWGEVVLDMGGGGAGLGFAEIDPQRTLAVRAQLPSLANRRAVSTAR